MKDNGKLMAIGVLSITAMLLLCTMVLLTSMPVREAQATGPSDRQGDYVMLPGDTIRGNTQVVYVIDIAARRVVAYYADLPKKRIEYAAAFELSKLND